ncbi:MAG: response regulator transcription factor [Aggregatilineales bacterium]
MSLEEKPADPASRPITLLIVDDHPLMRGGLRKLIELEADMKVVAEAGNGEDALQLAEHLQPDVVLLDINLPTLNGLEVTARLKALHRHIAVVMLTAHDQAEQMLYAMQVGASAYCTKGVEAERLFRIIRAVACGNYVIGERIYTPQAMHLWLAAQREGSSGEESERHLPLSPREMEVLRCVTRGLHNKAIAQELGISHQTVRNHITSILTKLNVRGRTQAAVYALKRGWVRAEEFNPPPENEND